MKHLEPLRTYLSPIFTAVVRMPETSDPASGSVRQNDASLKSSVSMPRYFCFTSSEPPSMIGAVARPLQVRLVPMPEQPQPISSSIRQPEMECTPGPPYSRGRGGFNQATAPALLGNSLGQVAFLAFPHATGRISFSAKL